MANREKILDGLAWAGIGEKARVAKIAALLVRTPGKMTKTATKEAVRDTSPPYGRGKAITEKVEIEHIRQKVIYDLRQKEQIDFEVRKHYAVQMTTRLNYAYAHAFGRPRYEPYGKRTPDDYWEWDSGKRIAYDEAAENRDRGDDCVAITHWGGHVVALLDTLNDDHHQHIATRRKNSVPVRTYLRDGTEDLVQAAISLGGPKVRAAFSRGIRVTTDWIGRKTTVHYAIGDVELPWRAVRYEEQQTQWGVQMRPVAILINGDTIIDDDSVDEDDD